MKPTRILVCGGRDYNNTYFIFKTMNELVPHFATKFCIIQGGARGADSHAGRWARERGTCNITVDANWEYYDKSAGTIRNEWMADFLQPELCIHFPGGIGTKRMVDYCIKLGIQTYGPL